MDAVFIGTVTKITRVPTKVGLHEYSELLVAFAVGERFRGINVAQAEVGTGMGGGDCGYGFRIGETYLVYAHRNKEDAKLTTSYCTRTRPLAEATEDLNYIRNLSSAPPGGVIYGKVHKVNYSAKEGEDSRMPVSDAELSIEGGSSRLTTRTDMQGGYRVTGLPQGKYKVTLKFPKGLTDHAENYSWVAEHEADIGELGEFAGAAVAFVENRCGNQRCSTPREHDAMACHQPESNGGYRR